MPRAAARDCRPASHQFAMRQEGAEQGKGRLPEGSTRHAQLVARKVQCADDILIAEPELLKHLVYRCVAIQKTLPDILSKSCRVLSHCQWLLPREIVHRVATSPFLAHAQQSSRMSKALSLVCKDCGAQLRSVKVGVVMLGWHLATRAINQNCISMCRRLRIMERPLDTLLLRSLQQL